MKKCFLSWLVLTVSLILLVGCGPGAEGASGGEKSKTFVVGTSADYEPFEFVDEKGDYAGFDIDLIEEIARRLDMELKIEDMEFGSLLASLEKGRIDAIIAAMGPNDERILQADFTVSYYETAQGILVMKGCGIEINKLEDMLSYTIAVQTGTILDEWVTAKVDAGELDKEKVFRYSDANAAAMDVGIGRVEVYFLDGPPAHSYAKDYDNLELVFEGPMPDTEGLAIAIPKGSKDIAEKLNTVIAELLEEGFIASLEDKWLS